MQVADRLRSNRLYASDEAEARFRNALEREWRLGESFEGAVREVDVSSNDPESVASVLASLETGVPILLGSRKWGNWTRSSLTRLRSVPVEDGSVIIRTGGSTGVVKFAIHNWNSLVCAASNIWNYWKRVPLSSALDLPLFHVSGLMPVVRALVSGGVLFEFGECNRVSVGGLRFGSVVPTTLFRAIEDSKKLEKLRCLDCVYAGGSSFGRELLEKARALQLPISLVYGMTETAAMIAIQHPADFLAGALPSVEAIEGNQIEVSESREILVKSGQLFCGYWGQESRQGEVWATGDIGAWDSSEKLVVEGRKGRVVNCGGETISLERIERAARELDGVEDALGVAVEDSEWGHRIHLLLESSFEGVDWREYLKESLDATEVPLSVKVLRKFPRSASGKVDLDQILI